MKAQTWRKATLLPFLYQTRTIQQSASRRVQTIHQSVHPDQPEPRTSSEHIPFEHEKPDDEREVVLETKSTITKKERAAFERLFDIAKPVPSVLKEVKKENYAQQFPEPLQKMAATKASMLLSLHELTELKKLEHDENLARIAAKKIAKETQRLNTEDEKARESRETHFQSIEKQLLSAKTDVWLWKVLEKKVFSSIELLKLDKQPPSPNSPNKPPKKGKEELKAAKRSPYHDISVIGPNYPSLLVTAMRQLRVSFPTSSLPFSILPAIKRLGRGSYVLGASTPLYNELIAATWTTYSDFRRIDELLQEMVNGGLEFDESTLQVLESIRLEGNKIKNGRYGVNRKLVWGTDISQNGWRKVIAWIPIVRERSEASAARSASEDEDEIDDELIKVDTA